MTEEFLKNAFSLMGEDSVTSIKIIKNKFTGTTYTVWKFHNFSITQILREINFGDSTSTKYAILTHLEVQNFAFYDIVHLLKAEIYQINIIQGLKKGKNGSFGTLIDSPKLISRKI